MAITLKEPPESLTPLSRTTSLLDSAVICWAMDDDETWLAVGVPRGLADRRCFVCLYEIASGRLAFFKSGGAVLGLAFLSSDRLLVVRSGRTSPRAAILAVPDGGECEEATLTGMRNSFVKIDTSFPNERGERTSALIIDSEWAGSRAPSKFGMDGKPLTCAATLLSGQPIRSAARFSTANADDSVHLARCRWGLARVNPNGNEVIFALGGSMSTNDALPQTTKFTSFTPTTNRLRPIITTSHRPFELAYYAPDRLIVTSTSSYDQRDITTISEINTRKASLSYDFRTPDHSPNITSVDAGLSDDTRVGLVVSRISTQQSAGAVWILGSENRLTANSGPLRGGRYRLLAAAWDCDYEGAWIATCVKPSTVSLSHWNGSPLFDRIPMHEPFSLPQPVNDCKLARGWRGRTYIAALSVSVDFAISNVWWSQFYQLAVFRNP